MQFFVSIELNNYFAWQIEMLIQSLRNLHLEDSLIVACYGDFKNITNGYTFNLARQKNVFHHQTVNKKLNKIHGLHIAITNNLLNPPFVILHPDMLITKIPNVQNDIVYNNTSLDVKGAIVFNKLFDGFTSILYEEMEKPPQQENLAWLHLFRRLDTIPFQEKIESTLVENNMAPIIHYKNGLPPFFNKKMFQNKVMLASKIDPWDTLLDNNNTKTINWIEEIVRSYELSKRL